LKKKEEPPRDYFVPNFGMDHDVADSLHNMHNLEAVHGNFDPESFLVQTNSDPICNSSGCTQYKHPKKESHPVDYFVPNFGVDQDIADSQSHEAAASAAFGHTWTPHKDPETEKWVVPTATAEF